ncbi:bleomycin resistance protein [Xenorhabdus bovienii]|uniref:bleomycin resistance protein n=1 Tax=Xenorhabdus bovienii TaxID=40576 RepID=UPI0023B23302|nr:bleomycin resistance protein [Xenorhabdus bovienii]MDE9447948.1 hypothetical protein [Xenorhabdus bovienii]
MIGYSTPNLPSKNLNKTYEFYKRLGFNRTYNSESWMILEMHDIVLEFFPHQTLTLEDNWFSCCIRLSDVPTFFNHALSIGVPLSDSGYPRITAPKEDSNPSVLISYLIDIDGNLIRLIQSD